MSSNLTCNCDLASIEQRLDRVEKLLERIAIATENPPDRLTRFFEPQRFEKGRATTTNAH